MNTKNADNNKNNKRFKEKYLTSHALNNLAISTTVSLTTKTALAPFERIKLMYQAQGELIKSGRLKTPWTSYYDLIKRTTQKEGFLSYWKGNGTYLLRYTLNSGIGLMTKDELLQWWSWIDVRLGIWTSGLLGIWASEHLGIWASGHLGIRASGYLVIWASLHLGHWASWHLVI